MVRHYSPAHLSLPLICVQIKDDAVALADVLAPPDAILQSAIGRENGEIYKNLFQSVLSSPHSMDRPHWWQEFTNTPVVGSRHKDMAEKGDTRAKL